MHKVLLPLRAPRFRYGNPSVGTVRWSWRKSTWISGMTFFGIAGAITSPAVDNLLVFIVTTSITLCFGHSLGMHRCLIHRSFACPPWLEYSMVYLGVLVGLAGPLGMVRTHDLRDWAQRQPRSHPYFRHATGFFKDGYWQLHCDVDLADPPQFQPESRIGDNRVYQFLERTWMLQQLPLAVALYALGGLEWVYWGVCLRVSVSILGHWLIGYFAHNRGPRDWHVRGASVQGHNVPFCGLITMGECWHNNHHAFPDSARLGLTPDQADPGWWCLQRMARWGLVWDLVTPASLVVRPELIALNPGSRASEVLIRTPDGTV